MDQKSDQSNIGSNTQLKPILTGSGQVKTWNELTEQEQKTFGTESSYDSIVKRYHEQQGSSGQSGSPSRL